MEITLELIKEPRLFPWDCFHADRFPEESAFFFLSVFLIFISVFFYFSISTARGNYIRDHLKSRFCSVGEIHAA